MSLMIASLNSGSNGNCYYVGNEQEAVLVDAGLSCKEIEIRMKRLNLSPALLKAVFISHEHADHIRGLAVFSKKYSLPVFITPLTLRFGRLKLERTLIRSFEPYEPVMIGSLRITAFPKAHDAADPCSFVVSCGQTKVGVFTDIGTPCHNLVKYFGECDAAFLEANYDEEMLNNGSYPYYLKHRIRGGKGHLSNRQALQLFLEHRPSYMSHLFLSHLSKNNNCPVLANNLFSPHAGDTEIIVASRDMETAVYRIARGEALSSALPPSLRPEQLSLAFG
ncbi:MAG TPA: MBL fold metallo-hydrolase [Flavisolibacter sp.]|nr:MBL fold metallo-hydrolase [Flavisolibacter sp.]